jgi:hypothetical protein
MVAAKVKYRKLSNQSIKYGWQKSRPSPEFLVWLEESEKVNQWRDRFMGRMLNLILDMLL